MTYILRVENKVYLKDIDQIAHKIKFTSSRNRAARMDSDEGSVLKLALFVLGYEATLIQV